MIVNLSHGQKKISKTLIDGWKHTYTTKDEIVGPVALSTTVGYSSKLSKIPHIFNYIGYRIQNTSGL